MLFSQKKFDLNQKEVSFDVDGKTLQGIQTAFDFGRDEVRKGWWRYAKRFGTPLDMRSHYLITIPSEATDGNVDLKIYSKTFLDQNTIRFNIGLESKQYQSQLKELLFQFKRDFYIRYYLNEIHFVRLSAVRISEEYATEANNRKKNQLLKQLKTKQSTIEKLKDEIKTIEKRS